jgi:hypothetical protein
MWESLQKFPMFCLTGNSVGSSLVQQALRVPLPDEFGGFRRENALYNSADYKAATNNQHSDTTQAVLDEIFPDPRWRGIAETLVGSHTVCEFEQTKEGRRLRRYILQIRGQLMGSMISFPILCCVNAAVLRCAYEAAYHTRFTLNEVPGLINGDDLLARMNNRVYRIWSSLVPRVGFEESPGKSYLSREWAQVNSRTFEINWIDWNSRGFEGPLVTKQRGFVNFGIIEGFAKGTNPQHEPDLELVSARSGSMVKEFDSLRPRVRERTIALFRERLIERYNAAFREQLIPYIPSLDNPVEYGGLGLGPGDRLSQKIDLKAANESRKWRYVKSNALDYLSGELLPNQDRWERVECGDLNIEGWKAYQERQRLLRSVTAKPRVTWKQEMVNELEEECRYYDRWELHEAWVEEPPTWYLHGTWDRLRKDTRIPEGFIPLSGNYRLW